MASKLKNNGDVSIREQLLHIVGKTSPNANTPIPWYTPRHLRNFGPHNSLLYILFVFAMSFPKLKAAYVRIFRKQPSYNWGTTYYIASKEVTHQAFSGDGSEM